MTDANTAMIRDLALAKSRIFIGNLPTCTRDELESICLPYGKVLGSLVQKNFGFVQFESEEIANKVAAALTKSTFKGNTITVRNAGARRAAPAPQAKNVVVDSNGANSQMNANECEIIVLDRKNTKYAEYVEDRLKRLNLRVDVLFPNVVVPIGNLLANISANGCLYAILVNNQNEEHNSITVNILHGQKAEHRNMPIEDAIKLIAQDYQNKKARDAAAQPAGTNNNAGLPRSVPIIPAGQLAGKERQPDAIKALVRLLANEMPLTVLQYDRIIKYLQDRRQHQIMVELGEEAVNVQTTTSVRSADKPPDPEIQLQKQLLNIMNKPSVAETIQPYMRYHNLQAVKEDEMVMDLLRDPRVQNALDSLLDSSLVGTVEKFMKF